MSRMLSAAARVVVVTAVVAGAASARAAHGGAMSLEDFRKAMTAIGDAFDVIEPMTPSPAYLLNSARGDALARLDVAGPHMEQVRGFFSARKKQDGVRFAEEALDAINVFRRELSRAEPNQADAIDALADVKRQCDACHRVYRDGTRDTGFRFKDGVL